MTPERIAEIKAWAKESFPPHAKIFEVIEEKETGAVRMALGLSLIPHPVKGDLDWILKYKTAYEQERKRGNALLEAVKRYGFSECLDAEEGLKAAIAAYEISKEGQP